jgi:hypothetical protein
MRLLVIFKFYFNLENRIFHIEQKALWNDQMRFIFIAAIQKQVTAGKSAENGLKKEAWTKIVSEVETNTGATFTKAQLHSQLQQLKRKYNTIKPLIDNSGFGSGFGWNDTLKIPTAPNQVWEDYIKVHKDAAEFRFKTLPYYDELDAIFTGKVTSGMWSYPSVTNAENSY